MASILKVDTLTGVTTAGSISVTGEGNSTTTNLQQGLAKHWVRFDQVNSNTFGDTFNSSSFTDVGSGHTLFTRTANLANDDYITSITTEVQVTYTNVSDTMLAGSTQLSPSFMSVYHVENGSPADTRTVAMMALGDLA
tara:strand:+ start:412 stop:825 length:414 start_codon:yes stop_codon:yes gene_type:complete